MAAKFQNRGVEMTAIKEAFAEPLASRQTRYPVIDTDVHQDANLGARPEVIARLPRRWRDHVAEYGLARPGTPGGDRPRHRLDVSRWDAEPPGGGAPMSNRDFARDQHLDRYDITAAILNDIAGFALNGSRGTPRPLAVAVCRAMNDDRAETWFAHDPRWHGSINAAYEVPDLAVEEIRRCMEEMGEYGSRWRQVLLAPDNLSPLGHEKYWPIFEICEHYNLPIGIHVAGAHRITPSGSPNYYFEEHCDWAAYNFPLVSSLVFEGVFERFPRLKFALVELAWSWAVPFGWRMDSAYQLMRTEVPHLKRLPSEYLRDHFWYTTQPMEEPERAEWFDDVLGTFDASGMADKLMYSSDYPHWDFDDPFALPRTLSDERRRRILGGSASALYRIELKSDSGVVLP
jgi:hypothetical protein